MAIYRQIQTNFWQDGFVAELTPEEKYFYFYLLTNSRTTQCGIFELNKRIVEAETGYNRETIEKLIKRFEEYGKILYCKETREIIIKPRGITKKIKTDIWVPLSMANNIIELMFIVENLILQTLTILQT